MENDHSDGMSFMELYSLSRQQFLVVNDTALRGQLKEFRDHKLIKSKKGRDNGEYLQIPVQNDILKDLIDMEAASCSNIA